MLMLKIVFAVGALIALSSLIAILAWDRWVRPVLDDQPEIPDTVDEMQQRWWTP